MTTEVPRDLVFKCKEEDDKWPFSLPHGLFGYMVSTFDNPQDFKNVQLVCRSWRAWIQRHFLVQHHLIERHEAYLHRSSYWC